MNIEECVKNFIFESQDIEPFALDNDFEIFEEGLVNSLFAIELMTFLENKFEIKIGMEDLNMDNFKSINCIKEFVEKKQAE